MSANKLYLKLKEDGYKIKLDDIKKVINNQEI